MSENLPLEAPDIDEEEILGSDDDEQESPKDYCKVKPIFKFFRISFLISVFSLSFLQIKYYWYFREAIILSKLEIYITLAIT